LRIGFLPAFSGPGFVIAVEEHGAVPHRLLPDYPVLKEGFEQISGTGNSQISREKVYPRENPNIRRDENIYTRKNIDFSAPSFWGDKRQITCRYMTSRFSGLQFGKPE